MVFDSIKLLAEIIYASLLGTVDIKNIWWREPARFERSPQEWSSGASCFEAPVGAARFGQLLAPFHGVEELVVGFGLLKAID